MHECFIDKKLRGGGIIETTIVKGERAEEMKKKLICYLLALGLLSSSMVVNASSLPNESTEAEETAEGESPEAETAQPVQEEKDVTQEPDGLEEETPDGPTEPETVAEPVETVEPEEAVAQETQQEPVDEQQEDSQEESGDDIQEPSQEEGLLGDQILVSGGDDRTSATVISLNTEYASQKKSCWYKFTTKSEPAYYELWMRNNATTSCRYHIYLYDGLNQMWDLSRWEGNQGTALGKLEPNHTYYLNAGPGSDREPDFYYLFKVTTYDDPEGNTTQEAYPLPLGEVYSASIVASNGYDVRDTDYYAIQTAEAGHYRIRLVNESLGSNNGFRIITRYNEELEKKTWIGKSRASNICLTLEGNTPYYIEAWCNDSGYNMNYNILAEYLTDHEGDTKETAYDLKVGEKYDTDLCARDDVDFYRLTPQISGRYVFEITNTNASKIGRKYYTVYTERNEPLISGDAYAGQTKSPEVELTAGNTYYLCIYSRSKLDEDEGTYVVSYGRKFPFSDVPATQGWKYDSIKYVYDNDIMNGISGTTGFAPDEPLTRAMFATVLYRMAGRPAVQFRNVFEDVPAGQYYSEAVIWAYNTGIVQGVSSTRFGTHENITREQIAKMLMEYGDKVGHYTMNETADLDSFPDRSDVSGWAVGYMRWAVGSGIVSGSNAGGVYYLDPKGNATRAQCAAMLMRFSVRYRN